MADVEEIRYFKRKRNIEATAEQARRMRQVSKKMS
jgi:hypothetical protein